MSVTPRHDKQGTHTIVQNIGDTITDKIHLLQHKIYLFEYVNTFHSRAYLGILHNEEE